MSRPTETEVATPPSGGDGNGAAPATPSVQPDAATTAPVPERPVNSWNEWDPLEEVVVGNLDGATVPSYHVSVAFDLPRFLAPLYRAFAGRRFPKVLVRAAQRELDQFIDLLVHEGIEVRRPTPVKLGNRYRTPHWSSSGFTVACPRDGYLVIGDEIIETPMAWRSRYFEAFAYRPLFLDYFRRGARWTAAPRPQLLDDLYDDDYRMPGPGEDLRYVINESELVFDAADFVRCGRDLFVTQSNVTNQLGIEWMRRHLGDRFRIHEIISKCRDPMHIDSTFMPLAPGRVLVNPEYCDLERLPPVLDSWEILVAPNPDPVRGWVSHFSMCSNWISINMLSLDERRVVVEASQHTMIKRLHEWGFEPIPCPFVSYSAFGGSFHCATLDVRRRGELQSY